VAGPLTDFGRRIGSVVEGDALKRVQRAAGMASKKAAADVAKDVAGSDMALSNFRSGRIRMASGFEIESSLVRLNLRPAGLWVLVDQGRKGSGPIYPRAATKRGSRRGRVAQGGRAGRAVMTPQGPRASSSYGPSKGFKVIGKTAARAADEAPKAAFRALQREIGRVVR